MHNFENFGFSEDILKGITQAGFVTPSPIQVEVIPSIIEGKDVIAQAHTGTGKTAAFGLPIMNKLGKSDQMLVIAPTRELAMQVSDELFRLGKFTGIRTAAICGGQSYTRQKSLIDSGVQIVAATPGRLLDLYESGKMNSFKPKYVVLDEADEMLDMGFLEDIKSIFKYLPKERQTLLFSATIPKPVEKLALSLLHDPIRVNTKGAEAATNADIDELYFVIEEYERDNSLLRLIDYYDPKKAIIFTRTKRDADRVSTSLIAKGYPAKCLHGDLTQAQREEVTKSFRKGDITLLVATDVAARGLDIADVSHVFNFHLPFDPESYVHRVGRTGRAGNKGIAITLVTPLEYRSLTRIKKATGSDIGYRRVPTLTETHENLVTTIVEEIKEIRASDFAASIVETLEKDMDLKEIAVRLASKVWANEGFSGPEHLGVKGKKLEKLQSDSENTTERSNNRRRDGKSGRDARSGYSKRKFGSSSGEKRTYRKNSHSSGSGKGKK